MCPVYEKHGYALQNDTVQVFIFEEHEMAQARITDDYFLDNKSMRLYLRGKNVTVSYAANYRSNIATYVYGWRQFDTTVYVHVGNKYARVIYYSRPYRAYPHDYWGRHSPALRSLDTAKRHGLILTSLKKHPKDWLIEDE